MPPIPPGERGGLEAVTTRSTDEPGPEAPADARARRPAPADRWFAAACALYGALTFSWYCVWKWGMAERSGDPAIFENCLWNATHGHGLRTSLEGTLPHLAVHFSPIILLFVPLYGLFASMHVVHLVVAIATSLAGWMFFKLARRSFAFTEAALVATAFLLHPTIVLQTFMEFHEQALGLLPLVLLVYGYRTGSRTLTLAAALALLATREDNAFLVVGLALYAVVTGRPRLGVALAVLGVGWLVLYTRLSRGMLGGGTLPRVFTGTYGLWGATPGEVVRSLLTRPGDALRHLASPVPRHYLVQLLMPFVGVLGFGDPIVLLMVPQLLLILLADPATRMYEIRMHYSLVPVVFLYLGSLAMLARLGSAAWRLRLGRITLSPARIAALAMLLASVSTMPVWMARAAGRLNPWRDEVRRVMSMVPDTASVAAPSYMLNQMTHRRQLEFVRGDDFLAAEYVILEDPDRLYFPGTTVEHFYSAPLAARLTAAGYRVLYAEQGWHVWRRDAAASPR
jgi:uncharacterized membrane protein